MTNKFQIHKKLLHYSIFLYGVMMFIYCACFMPAYANMLQHQNVDVKVNMKETIYDKHSKNGITYRIFEAIPNKTAPQAGWPIIYLLDGNATYQFARDQNPDAVLIGIGYPTDDKNKIIQQRYFDLTTKTEPKNIPLRAGMIAPQTGGEEKFRHFIIEELMPDINHRLPVDAKQATLFGHSLGGIFALQTFIKKPNAFQTICAIDPSIWWDKHAFINDLKSFSPTPNMPRLLIETAGKKVQKTNIDPKDAEKLKSLRSGPNGHDVAKTMHIDKKVNVFYRNFNDQSHGTIIKPAIQDCLALSLNQDTPLIQTLISQEKNHND